MKRFAILLLVVCACAVVFAGTLPRLVDVGTPATVARGTGEMLKADQWHLIRAISADDTAFSTSNSTWTNGQYFKRIDERAMTCSVMFLAYGDGTGAGDPSSGTFSWKLYVVRRHGPIELVADGTEAIGGMYCSHFPHSGVAVSDASQYCFGELPVLSNDYWATTVAASGTTDSVGVLNFDPLNAWGLDLRISSLSGITTLYTYARFTD